MQIPRTFAIVGSVGAAAAVAVLIWLAFFRAQGYRKDALAGMVLINLSQQTIFHLSDALFKQCSLSLVCL